MTEVTIIPPHSLIIRSKENAQSQEEDDNSHQAFKKLRDRRPHRETPFYPFGTPIANFHLPIPRKHRPNLSPCPLLCNLEQIEFPLKFDNHRSEIKEASIKTAKRFKAEFKFLSTHLPNLNTTHVDIFCTYTQPCQRLLVCPVLYTPANFSPERRLAPFRAPIAKRHRSQRFSKSIFTIALKCCYSMALSVFHSWNGVLEIATLHIRTDNSTMAGKPGSTSNETSVTRPGI